MPAKTDASVVPENEVGESDSGFLSEVAEQYRSMPQVLVLLALREMFSQDLIDPDKINEPEYLWNAVLDHHNEVVRDIEFQTAIYRPFLDVAEYALDIDQPAVAVVLVATAVEHILNLHFRDMLTRKGFDEKQVKSVIRSCRMEAKTGWLMQLVGMPPLPDDLKKRIDRAVELRNCLVHFKAEPTRLGAFKGGWDRLRRRLQELDTDDLMDLPDDLEYEMSWALIEADPDLKLAVEVYQTAVEAKQ